MDPEDRECWPDPDTIAREVERLVHHLWWRLPMVVRTVIACGIKYVMLRTSEESVPPVFEDRELRIDLQEDVMSRAWQAEVGGALAWGFGMAFLEALSVQVPGEDSWTRPIIDEARARQPSQRSDDAPSLTEMLRHHDRKASAYISYMAEALATAWGFEEEIAALRAGEQIRRPSEWEEECGPAGDPDRYAWAQVYCPRPKRVKL